MKKRHTPISALFSIARGLLILGFGIILTAENGNAALFSLPVLDTTMTDPVFRTLGAGFAFRPLEPASGLGRVFGFYFGAEAIAVDASAASAVFTSGSTSFLPSGDFELGLGIPLGLTVELGFLPSISISGTTFGKYAGALKWTVTDTLLSFLPFNLAFRASYSSATVNYSQALSGGTVTVNYSAGIVGTQLVLSKSFGVFEPYVGLGLLNHSSSLSSSGTVNLFGSTFPAGTQSATASGLSFWPQVGALLKFGFFGLAFEYDNMFGITSWNTKVSFRF